jgi:glycosyltransferase involved in cell wall biosynthesis
MNRVLIIAFCYPPTQVIGSVRPAGLAKYLPRFGWEPVILTPKVERSRGDSGIIETGYRSVVETWKARLGLDSKRNVHQQLRLPMSAKPGSRLFHTRLLGLARYFLTYQDEMKGWIPFAERAIEEMAGQGKKIDAILTTSPPFSTHLIGRKAKKILGRPWIADFRDLWTQNLASPYPRLAKLQSGLEKRTLNEADALVTVSDPWVARLRQRYPAKKIVTITNGFDPDHFAAVSRELTSTFTISYTGNIYQSRRGRVVQNPTLLFQALRELFDEEVMSPGDVRVRFYGPVEPWLTTLVEQYRLQGVVGIHGVITRAEALQRQAESQILLLLGWTDPREIGQHTGKLFEYLGAARPILAVGGGRSVLTDTLNETAAGIHAFSREDVRKFLITAYGEFKTQGHVPYHGVGTAVENYTHFQMARRFAEVLNLVSGRSAQANASCPTHSSEHIF